MTVNTFDPEHLRIQMSDAAIKHLVKQLAASQQKIVRLAIKESGCSGYMYELEYADTSEKDDLRIEVRPDLPIYVSGKYLPVIHNTQVDYVT